ncbi:MAG TPA: SDR family NAD(P)-dependent oxidoreductase [Acidimicrobiia bacterium]|nr:SDR family NAD(P)-dependent oxidoreductase [Acidimicrobiia bacterium]
MTDFTGRVAWVAGAARRPGIGRATAVELARRGADVACIDVVTDTPTAEESYRVSRDALDATAAAVVAEGRRALAIPVDLTDAAAVEESVAATIDAFGRLDVCCNLSGGTGPNLGNGSLVGLEPASWHATLDANLTAVWLGARACARRMIEQGDGGAIVSLSSSAGIAGEAGFGAFSAARGGVIRLTEALATEVAPYGIRANAVCPLGVSPEQGGGNPGLEHGVARRAGGLDDWVHATIPLGRMQRPGETAAVIVFLASDAASFVSGQAITVAGAAHV